MRATTTTAATATTSASTRAADARARPTRAARRIVSTRGPIRARAMFNASGSASATRGFDAARARERSPTPPSRGAVVRRSASTSAMGLDRAPRPSAEEKRVRGGGGGGVRRHGRGQGDARGGVDGADGGATGERVRVRGGRVRGGENRERGATMRRRAGVSSRRGGRGWIVYKRRRRRCAL